MANNLIEESFDIFESIIFNYFTGMNASFVEQTRVMEYMESFENQVQPLYESIVDMKEDFIRRSVAQEPCKCFFDHVVYYPKYEEVIEEA